MSFLNSEVFPKAAAGFLALRGLIPYNKKVVEQNLEIFKKLAQIVEDHLTQNTYFVGERFSLADLYAVPLFKRIFDFLFGKEERKAYPAITRWFSTVIQQDWYSGLMSDYKFIEEPIKYTPPKKEEPKKEKKEEKKKPQPADEPPKEKAAPHPLASLGAAKMPLDEWKRVYSNQETREQALPWFWEHYNPEDYSLWKVSYKYNDELTLVFMSNNLIGGFFARLSSSTKYMFGCEVVYGENNDNGIVGVFLVRGQDFKPAFEVAPDWDGYDYVKLDAAKPEDKTLIEDIWSWDKPYNGKEIADGKVFK